MQFGLYAPIPMATVGSPEVARAVTEALAPLPDGRLDAQFDLGVDLLLAADGVGFDLVLFAERHLGNDIAAWVLASAIGSRLNRIRALVAVHPGLWDPVMVGKLAVSLDRVCRGRMALNIVNGWFDEEFRMFGGTVLQGEERYRRTIEFIDILRGLWANETFSYAGQFYKVDNGQLLLKPASPTLPEIYSVSRSDRGRDFIADHCDWWFVDYPKSAGTTDEVLRGIEDSVADMNRRTSRLGKKVRYALNPFVALGRDEQDALDTAIERIFAFDPDPDTRKIESRMLPATKIGCIGSPDTIRRQIRRFEELGIELILCKFIPTIENVQRIGEEIIAPMRVGAPLSKVS
ncbi:MAG: dimethylsulfone monooxygenase [Alphaproteobacteria bacterium]|nr:dimethylsulfone monooxygenase [Alphaproteobacteria bacterium]